MADVTGYTDQDRLQMKRVLESINSHLPPLSDSLRNIVRMAGIPGQETAQNDLLKALQESLTSLAGNASQVEATPILREGQTGTQASTGGLIAALKELTQAIVDRMSGGTGVTPVANQPAAGSPTDLRTILKDLLSSFGSRTNALSAPVALTSSKGGPPAPMLRDGVVSSPDAPTPIGLEAPKSRNGSIGNAFPDLSALFSSLLGSMRGSGTTLTGGGGGEGGGAGETEDCCDQLLFRFQELIGHVRGIEWFLHYGLNKGGGGGSKKEEKDETWRDKMRRFMGYFDKGVDFSKDVLSAETHDQAQSKMFGGLEELGKKIPGAAGAAVEALGHFGKQIAEASQFVRDWGKQLQETSFQFASVSGAMAVVQAQHDMRQLRLDIERGNRRAPSARRVSEASDALERSNAALDDKWNDIKSDVFVYLSKWGLKRNEWEEKALAYLEKILGQMTGEEGDKVTGILDWDGQGFAKNMAEEAGIGDLWETYGRPDRLD